MDVSLTLYDQADDQVLLSSHRNYASELDWEWLRNDSAYADALVFEPTADERKFQMIVTDRWKSKVCAP